ncbi:ribosome biogenesis protein BMS1/TSR1 [Blastocladiella britannica]|nr:ribosome biogenesis protein BMS1/TSR1 [Blastocladiella britannica]
MDAVEQRKQLEAYLDQRKRQLAEEADDDREFPDEVETPLTVPAKVRFARYRGLKSSRKSPWDPKENLPREYSQLFHFESWRRTRARVVKEHQLAPVAAGQYVTVHIRNVPALAMSHFFMPAVLGDVPVGDGASTALFWLVGLLPYEHKVTTVQFTAQRRDEYTAPIRSKDAAVLQIGWRRVEAAPVWSEHARDGGNKVFKFERFLQPKRVAMGTVFAPNTFFGPVLMLQPGTAAAGEHRSDPALVAVGLVAGADADRVMAKRVVLTGHPYKVHRKIAVIRWMFYAPDDIMWFKPVQLYTKYGRTGHIRESMGTHGYMKCIFDGPVQQHDTICMNLYKRVFPKRFGETYFSSGRDAGERWDSVVVGGKDGEDEDEEDEDAMDM